MFKKTIFSILLAFFLSFLIPSLGFAAAATLKLSPASGEYTVGNTFSLDVKVDSGGDKIVAVKAVLTYDATVLEYQSINFDGSPLEGAAGVPSISGGKIDFSRLTFSGGVSGENQVAKIAFKVLKEGTAVNFVQAESQVILSGEIAQNILSSVQNGSYTIKSAPTETGGATPAPTSTSTTDTVTTTTPTGTTITISKSKSTIKTDKTQATADGKDAITLTITVRDSNKNVVKDKKPTVTVSGSDNKLSDLTLVGDNWVATLTSTKAEEKTITVKIDKTTLGTTKVTFTAVGAPAPAPQPTPPTTPTPSPTPKPPISITKLPSLVSPYALYIEGGAALLLTIGYLIYLIRKRRFGG